MKVHLSPVHERDLSLVETWLRTAHVSARWGDAEENLAMLRQPPPRGHWRAIIEADGRKVGLVLWQHPTRTELDVAGLNDISTSVIDIDIMIGERNALGRGIGPIAIRLVAEQAFVDPSVPFLIGCAAWDNLASQRAFAKAGFQRDREFDDIPHGIHVLMVRQRQEEKPK